MGAAYLAAFVVLVVGVLALVALGLTLCLWSDGGLLRRRRDLKAMRTNRT